MSRMRGKIPPSNRKVTTPQLAETLVATGGNMVETAKELGVSLGTVYYRINNDEELAELVNRERLKMAECVPDVAEGVRELAKLWANRETRKKLTDLEQKQGQISAHKILESVDLLPSTGHTYYIQKILMNVQNNNAMNPVLEALLTKHFKELSPPQNMEEQKLIEAPEADFEEVFK